MRRTVAKAVAPEREKRNRTFLFSAEDDIPYGFASPTAKQKKQETIIELPPTPDEVVNVPIPANLTNIRAKTPELQTRLDEEESEVEDQDQDEAEYEVDAGKYVAMYSRDSFVKRSTPGTLPFDVRIMGLLHSYGQKKVRAESFLFENLRAYVLGNAYDEIAKDKTESSLQTAMFQKVVTLLELLPLQEYFQRNVLQYIMKEVPEKYEFDPTNGNRVENSSSKAIAPIKYAWPNRFIGYVLQSGIMQETRSKGGKNGKEVSSLEALKSNQELCFSMGEKWLKIARVIKSEVSKVNTLWIEKQSTDETNTPNILLNILEIKWKQYFIENARGNARRNKNWELKTAKEYKISIKDARDKNVETAGLTAQMKLDTGLKCKDTWYPPYWIYFLCHGAPSAELTTLPDQQASTVNRITDALKISGDVSMDIMDSYHRQTNDESVQSISHKRKRADSAYSDNEAVVTTVDTPKAFNLAVTHHFSKQDDDSKSTNNGPTDSKESKLLRLGDAIRAGQELLAECDKGLLQYKNSIIPLSEEENKKLREAQALRQEAFDDVTKLMRKRMKILVKDTEDIEV